MFRKHKLDALKFNPLFWNPNVDVKEPTSENKNARSTVTTVMYFLTIILQRDERFFPTWNEIRTGVCWSAGWVMRNNFLPLIMRKLKHFIRSIFLIFVLLRITWSSFHRKWSIAFDSVYSDYINLKKKSVTIWIWEKSKKVLENHWHKCFWIFINKTRKNLFPNM